MKVASIGECMMEFSEAPDGTLRRGFGGDTLNTAIYLARLGVAVEYITAVGDDPFSAEIVRAWETEGVGTARVRVMPGRVIGLYVIRTDAAGERSFYYWRDSAPARDLLRDTDAASVAQGMADVDLLYFSFITLSLYGAEGRRVLFDALVRFRAQGKRVAFDTNFRPRGWPDSAAAQAVMRQALAMADMIFASEDDMRLLFGHSGEPELAPMRGRAEIVFRTSRPGVRLLTADGDVTVPAREVAEVVDTTAAGDSFAAGYLAARLRGGDPVAAAQAGHALAAVVIGHRGAIIPRAFTPEIGA